MIASLSLLAVFFLSTSPLTIAPVQHGQDNEDNGEAHPVDSNSALPPTTAGCRTRKALCKLSVKLGCMLCHTALEVISILIPGSQGLKPPKAKARDIFGKKSICVFGPVIII